MYFEEMFKDVNRCNCFMYISISLHAVLDRRGQLGSCAVRRTFSQRLNYFHSLTDHTDSPIQTLSTSGYRNLSQHIARTKELWISICQGKSEKITVLNGFQDGGS